MINGKGDEVNPFRRCMWEGKLRVLRELGEGAHGDVLLVQDSDFNKFGAKTVPMHSNVAGLLENEYKIYKHLGCQGRKVKGLPIIHMYGVDPSHENFVLVMNRLGASLREVMKMNGGSLPVYSVFRIGCQMLRRLEYVHGKGIVHGDIKPRNILCGRKTFEKIYVVDFGLANFFREGKNKKHKRMTSGNRFQGTEDFASRHMHKGFSLSRRDDLESLGFTLIFLMKGILPWSRVPNDEDLMEPPKPVDHNEILAQKERISIRDLCDGLPSGMEEYMRYVYDMDYYQEPDYLFLTDLLMNGMKRLEHIGNVDNGKNLDIWPDANEKRMFMGQREEDAIWERHLQWLENLEKANVQDQQQEGVQHDVQMDNEPSEEMLNSEEGEQMLQSEEDEKMLHSEEEIMTCNLFQLVRSFKSWRPLLSVNDMAELSKASTVQNAPVILREGVQERSSLFRRFCRLFRSKSSELEDIYLCYEEDSWSEASDQKLW